ncbi:MAG: hypothetical protein GX654_07835 [Desulfatiglans sp.]|nr:hypothetical protein [Desulfatiglans sp.]
MRDHSKLRFSIMIGFLLVFLALCETSVLASDTIIVGNKNLSVSTLSKETIQKIFLGEQTTWEDGSKIKFAYLQVDPTDKIFLREYMYYTNIRYIRHWRSQVFSGKGEMPPMLQSDAEMLKFIQDNNGSIGFVTGGADTGSVKTLTVK